jgi:5-methylcytosine-specific restriction endonuclease McrA
VSAWWAADATGTESGETTSSGIPRETWRRVLERDGERCQRCGAEDGLHVHHIVFRSQGGTHDEDNLVTVCNNCHEDIHQRRTAVKRIAGHFYFTRTARKRTR